MPEKLAACPLPGMCTRAGSVTWRWITIPRWDSVCWGKVAGGEGAEVERVADLGTELAKAHWIL